MEKDQWMTWIGLITKSMLGAEYQVDKSLSAATFSRAESCIVRSYKNAQYFGETG
jgi:hypothetical protein